jgi:hypothetical protein
MNWLESARREFRECARCPTANTAERTLTAVTAVPPGAFWKKSKVSTQLKPGEEQALEDFEERAAIMEFDGGLSRDEAERAAWASIINRYRVH